MAGLIGIFGYDELWKMSRFTFYGLMALQHRGQETCGIATWDGKEVHIKKGKGLVDVFFSEDSLHSLPGWIGVGHVSTKNPSNDAQIQPVWVEGPVPLAICYDGMVLNSEELASKYDLTSHADAEVLGGTLSGLLSRSPPLEAVHQLMEEVRGPFSMIALTGKGDMIAARDRTGIRPMAVGNFGFDYGVVASESAALDVIGADFKTDLNPGEAYQFTSWKIERKQLQSPLTSYCAFEYVYLSRPDSVENGRSIYEARIGVGRQLAEHSDSSQADVVIGVPETANPVAMAISNELKMPIGLGFVQTGRRVRSAIRPTQFERLVGVQLKLNPIRAAVAGKRILLVDDSVVRGTTTRNTVNLMRNKHGAKEIHVRIGSPHLVAPCPYGVEVPEKDELIAANLSEDEVSKVVGADTFKWLPVDGLVESVGVPRERLCLGCFTGKYPLDGAGQ